MTDFREKTESVVTDLLELTDEMCALMTYLMGDDVGARWRDTIVRFTGDMLALAETLDEKADR